MPGEGSRTDWAFDAIGTRWVITTEQVLDASLRDRVTETIDTFDREWSRFRADSVVSYLAEHGGSRPAPEDTGAILGLYRELSEATSGAVNPLVGSSLSALGYDAQYSFRLGDPHGAPERWPDQVQWSSTELSVTEPTMIDIGALGKGYLVDKVATVLTTELAGGVVVDAGGDISVRGISERIGLEHPYRSDKAVGVCEMSSGALCASATTRRSWGDGLHHVLDARTGVPVHRVAATWAWASLAVQADAIATALFFPGGPELAHRWGVEWARMSTEGALEWSPRCPAEVFVA